MLPNLHQRVLTPERLDEPEMPVDELRQSLAFLYKVNRYLAGTHAVLGHLKRWSRRWPRGQTIAILDIATGGGDIPLAIVRWAEGAGHDVRVTGVDRNPQSLALAAEHSGGHPQLNWLCADALALPFLRGSFDYVISSMFLHHLNDVQVLTTLTVMDHLARRGVIWNDLLRHYRAYAWIKLLSLAATAAVRHDGPASVAAGFTKSEVLGLRNRLELDYLSYRRHFGHRFTLAGERKERRARRRWE